MNEDRISAPYGHILYGEIREDSWNITDRAEEMERSFTFRAEEMLSISFTFRAIFQCHRYFRNQITC